LIVLVTIGLFISVDYNTLQSVQKQVCTLRWLGSRGVMTFLPGHFLLATTTSTQEVSLIM